MLKSLRADSPPAENCPFWGCSYPNERLIVREPEAGALTGGGDIGASPDWLPRLERLHCLVLDGEPLHSILVETSRLAVVTVAGCDAAGIVLSQSGRMVRAASSELADSIDNLQHELGEGPGVEAARTGGRCTIADMGGDGRWPRFASAAAGHGVSAAYSSPLSVSGRHLGALNMYSCGAGFDDRDVEQIEQFLPSVAVLVAHAAEHHRQRQLANQLKEALDSRDVISQAKGILVAQARITSDDAFDKLRRVSQSSNIKLRDFARELVDCFGGPEDGQQASG